MRQGDGHMNKRKIGAIVGFFVLFITIFTLGIYYWNLDEKRSMAEYTLSEPNNNSNQEIITFDTTFYNYRYDNEIYNNSRNQGAQSCYDGGIIPFGSFDSKLSDYYKDNNVKVGIYTGNFYNYYGGLASKKIEFPGYWYFRWSANIANRHVPYDAVCQNIVSDSLKDFDVSDYASGTLMSAKNTSGEVATPYFDSDFLSSKVNGVSIGATKEHVGFPFRKVTSGSKKGYYEFDSSTDVVRFDGMSGNTSQDSYYFGSEGKLNYYYNEKKVYCAASSSAQFFPYNNSNGSGQLARTSSEQKTLDYGFGVRFNIPFRLSEDGTIDGKSMVFNFEGDDDVWIFLDGELVLDLGGQHGKATGTIDFSGSDETAKATVAKIAYANGSSNASDTVMSDKILTEDTYIKSYVSKEIAGIKKGADHQHVLTVFYMERGMLESNFHMLFNFVPANEVMPTPTPTIEPVTAEKATGTLKIKNQLQIPSSINDIFLQAVYDLAEEDVFQYSVENQGTKAENVDDSEIKYPSGKLTVRQNDNTTNKEESYLSFGAEPTIRMYINIGEIESKLQSWNPVSIDGGQINFSKFAFSKDSDGNIQMDDNAIKGKKLYKFDDSGMYYFDVVVGEKFKILTNWFTFSGTNQALLFLYGSKTGNKLQILATRDMDGKILTPESVHYYNRNIYFDKYTLETPTDITKYPPIGGGDVAYSKGLPYQSASELTPTFVPTSETNFNKVKDTSYELGEAYLAPLDSNILINSESTSGITDSNGVFGLFYDDSATFLKQFAKGSQMRVIQKDSLLQPERYSGSMSENTDATEALTTFVTPTSARSASNYYYTDISAVSSSVDGTASEAVDVSYDYRYNFLNGSSISESDPVNITETFTNTVKTGSLVLSKKLNGNLNDWSNYSYGYEIKFSNVFGGSDSTLTLYTGAYKLVEEDGTTTEKTTANGVITLQPGQKAVIAGIPVGTKYQVKESVADGTIVNDMNVVYKASLDDDTFESPEYNETSAEAGIAIDKETRTITGEIPCSIINKFYNKETAEYKKVKVVITYTNQFGAISITKRIAGDVNEAQYYKNTTGKEKEYNFTIKNVSDATLYSGPYKVYTYKNSIDEDDGFDVTTKSTTNGQITLKPGEKAEICELPLSVGNTYTVTENIDDTDIFYLGAIKITEGQAKTATTSAITTMTLDETNASVQMVYNNRYSKSFIQLDKYVDALYYGDKAYSKDKSYQDLTNAKQSFLFEIKQYKTEADAKNDENVENSFTVTLNLDETAEKLSAPKPSVDGTTFSYKISKKVQVVGNRYYRIKEDTTWSWKYKLVKVNYDVASFIQENFEDTRFGDTINDNEVILKSNRDEKALPIAQFYNKQKDTDIEGDTDDAINEIH